MKYDIIIGRSESDKKKLGDKGLIFIGKNYVKMGQTTSLSNDVYMDVSTSHVLLVSGKRGCITGDTKVFTEEGYKDIKDFNEKKDKIYSFNTKNNKFELEKAKLLKYNINEELFIFELQDGQKLIATSEHPFLTKSKKRFSWKIASEINKEDKIVSLLQLPRIKQKYPINKRIARLIGFVLADGTIFVQKGRFKDGRGYWYNGTKKRIRIINAQEEVLKKAKEDLEKEFKIVARRYKREKYNCEVIESEQQKVVNKFIQWGVPSGKKSNIIRIPSVIFQSTNNIKAEFLKALFSCDGFICKKGENIEYYSNSKNFQKDLQLLLQHFGIHGKIRDKKVTCNGKKFLSYALSIWDYKSIKIFEKKIGFFSEEKRKRLKKRTFWRMHRRKKTEYISEDLFFERIEKISKKKFKIDVYDLRVPKNHSFIANGIISHNSGKSYSLSVIAEEMANLPKEVNKNLSILLLDTMGIFWSMKYPNERQADLLKTWGLKPKGLNVTVYTPKGKFKEYKKKNIPTDFNFSVKPSELSPQDWVNVFDLKLTSDLGVLVERIITQVKEEKKSFSLDDIINKIKKDKKSEQNTRNAAENRFIAAKGWGLFDVKGTEIKDIVKRGQVSILDISCYSDWNLKCLVVSILSKKLLQERIDARKLEELKSIEEGQHYLQLKEETEGMPLVWMAIDEAHEFLPKNRKTPATDALISLLREGRQPGISLILATQQPGQIHHDVITQSDIILSHRVTARLDIEALNSIMQSYLTKDLLFYLNNLPTLKGSAIILDDNSERIYPIRVRPKMSWHGGETPSSVKIKKKLFG